MSDHLNTPPKATSSPKMQAVWSVVRAMSMASVMDCSRVIFSVGPGNRIECIKPARKPTQTDRIEKSGNRHLTSP